MLCIIIIQPPYYNLKCVPCYISVTLYVLTKPIPFTASVHKNSELNNIYTCLELSQAYHATSQRISTILFCPSVSTIILLFHTILPNEIGSFTWNSRTAFVLFVCLFSYIEFLSTKWRLAIHKNIQNTKIIIYQSPEFLSIHHLAKCTFLRERLTGMNVKH